MALIRTFSEYAHSKPRVHGEVKCGYAIFQQNGQRYIQLDTYGSAERQIPGKTSQTVQLDAESARDLLAILSRTFPENG